MKQLAKKIFYKLPISNEKKEKIKKAIRKNNYIDRRCIISANEESYEKLKIENPKKISVVIPNYNYGMYIEERIDTVINQTYPIYELIILDDKSEDNSIEVIENKLKTISGIQTYFVKNEVNSGNVFAQWKKGFELVSGDYVWIAEADDSSNPKFLESVMVGFEKENTIISYCESLTIDSKGQVLMGDLREWIDIFKIGKWDKNYFNNGIDEIVSTLCINNTIANVSSVVFKNGDYFDIIEKAKQFKLAGDWFVYMNLLEKGNIAYCRESLNYHRMQEQGVTLSINKEKEFEEIVRMQNYALNNYKIEKKTKERILQRREMERQRFGL